jgi:cell division septal protein FtsQ
MKKRAAVKKKNVSVKSNPKRTLRSSQERRHIFLVKLLTAFVALLILTVTVIVGYVYLKNLLFVKNSRYTITTMELHSSGSFSLEKFREYTEIQEGDNLYSFALKDIEDLFVQKVPNVRHISIKRQLPDTLTVNIMERTPVLRLTRRSNLCVDRDGYIFAVSANKLKFLPYISGSEYRTLRPGGKVTGRALSAVKLVNLGSSSTLDLPISNVNISPEDYITVFLSNGKRLRIAWDGMDENTDESLEELNKKLMRFVLLLNSPEGQSKYSFSTIDNSFYGR